MTSPLLRDAARRVEHCIHLREQTFLAWINAEPGTYDNETLWRAYELAREDEDLAHRSFFTLWRECERAKGAPLDEQLEATARALEIAKREARR